MMDGQNLHEPMPKLPPPDELPLTPPSLSEAAMSRLRHAYTVWCAVTVSAAILTLGLLAARGITTMREEESGYLRRLLFTRVLGIGRGDQDGTLIDLMLEQVLYPRGGTEAVIARPTGNTLPRPARPLDRLPETSDRIPAAAAPPPLDVYAYDPSLVPAGELPILPLDLSLQEYGAAYISNETSYTPDLAALLGKEDILPPYSSTSAAVYPPGDPLVLILHTHGTEAYSPDGAISYPDTADYARSSDPAENVLAVGERMAEILRENGVPTLHCVILHDKSAYRDAYTRAAETIAAYLAEYPTIEYILDVHRDALIRGENELVRPVVALDGEAVAQVMILAGSDYKGAYFPDWQNNLAFALQLRERLNEEHPRIARPVYLRASAFNEHFGPRSLLLEIGASGNSLPEALRAGERVAQTLADMIRRK